MQNKSYKMENQNDFFWVILGCKGKGLMQSMTNRKQMNDGIVPNFEVSAPEITFVALSSSLRRPKAHLFLSILYNNPTDPA